jgi:hypothetical protein
VNLLRVLGWSATQSLIKKNKNNGKETEGCEEDREEEDLEEKARLTLRQL